MSAAQDCEVRQVSSGTSKVDDFSINYLVKPKYLL